MLCPCTARLLSKEKVFYYSNSYILQSLAYIKLQFITENGTLVTNLPGTPRLDR